MKQVKIMRGVSGAGKSTYIKDNFPNAEVCSADHFFIKNGQYIFDRNKLGAAHYSCKKKFEEALMKGKDLVVVDNTNTTLKEIKPYMELAKQYNYDVEIIQINCVVNVAAKRNAHGVPEDTIVNMAAKIRNSELPKQWRVKVIEN